MVEACSFAGTGNVLKIQTMLHHCDEHIVETKKDDKDENKDEPKEESKRDDTFQSFAVLAIALISMGEEIGAEMSLRQFNHLVRPITLPSVLLYRPETDALRRASYSKICTTGHWSC